MDEYIYVLVITDDVPLRTVLLQATKDNTAATIVYVLLNRLSENQWSKALKLVSGTMNRKKWKSRGGLSPIKL